MVHDGESILLDAGTSVAAYSPAALAAELQHDISLTVATTSLAVLEALAEVRAIYVERL